MFLWNRSQEQSCDWSPPWGRCLRGRPGRAEPRLGSPAQSATSGWGATQTPTGCGAERLLGRRLLLSPHLRLTGGPAPVQRRRRLGDEMGTSSLDKLWQTNRRLGRRLSRRKKNKSAKNKKYQPSFYNSPHVAVSSRVHTALLLRASPAAVEHKTKRFISAAQPVRPIINHMGGDLNSGIQGFWKFDSAVSRSPRDAHDWISCSS